MKKMGLICSTALMATGIAPEALAQHVEPSGSAYTATGIVALSGSGFPSLLCNAVITGVTGSDLGGAHTGHASGGIITSGTFSGSGACNALAIDLSNNPTFDIASYSSSGLGAGTGDFLDLALNIGCTTPSTVPFTIVNTSTMTSEIELSGSIGGCWIEAIVNVDLVVVP